MALSTAKRARNAPLAAASGAMDGSWMERKVTITTLIFCKNTAYL